MLRALLLCGLTCGCAAAAAPAPNASGADPAPAPSASGADPAPARPTVYRDTQGTSVRFGLGDAAFADRVVSFEAGEPATKHEGYRNPEAALGAPQGDRDQEVVTLGCRGRLTLELVDNVLVDEPGADLHVFEVGPQIEPMRIELSADGRDWLDVGAVEGQPASVDIAAVARPGEAYRFIRISDLASGCDSDYPGADLDAVGAIHGQLRR